MPLSRRSSIRSDNRRIYRPRQHQEADNHNEPLKQQLQRHRPSKVESDAADQIVKVLRAHVVGNDRVGEERNQRGEEQ